MVFYKGLPLTLRWFTP